MQNIDIIDMVEKEQGDVGLYHLWIRIAQRLATQHGYTLPILYEDLMVEFEPTRQD